MLPCLTWLQEREEASQGAALTLVKPGRASAAGIQEGREEAMGSPLYCCHLFLAQGLLAQCCCRGVGKTQPCVFTGAETAHETFQPGSDGWLVWIKAWEATAVSTFPGRPGFADVSWLQGAAAPQVSEAKPAGHLPSGGDPAAHGGGTERALPPCPQHA